MSTLTERMDRFELDLRRMQRELEALRREARTSGRPEPEGRPRPSPAGRRGAGARARVPPAARTCNRAAAPAAPSIRPRRAARPLRRPRSGRARRRRWCGHGPRDHAALRPRRGARLDRPGGACRCRRPPFDARLRRQASSFIAVTARSQRGSRPSGRASPAVTRRWRRPRRCTTSCPMRPRSESPRRSPGSRSPCRSPGARSSSRRSVSSGLRWRPLWRRSTVGSARPPSRSASSSSPRRPSSPSSRRWELLLAVVLAVVGAQAAWLVAAEAPAADAATLAVVAALALVTLTAACAWQVTGRERAVSRLAGPIVLADVGFVLLSSQALLASGTDRGVGLAVAALTVGVAWLVLREVQPDLALVLGAAALALAAVAVGNLVSGDGLTLAWAAESALLSSSRTGSVTRACSSRRSGTSGSQRATCSRSRSRSASCSRRPSRPRPPFRRSRSPPPRRPRGLLAPQAYRETGEVGVLAFLASFRAALLERRARVVETLLAGAAALGVVAFGVFASRSTPMPAMWRSAPSPRSSP